MLEVKHLVVEQVFKGITGAGRPVEYAADHDGVVGSIVMAERPLGHLLAPCELGPAEEPTKETEVKRVEYFFQLVEAAVRTGEALAAAGTTDQLGLAGDGGAGCEPLVAQVLHGVDGFLVELGNQDMSDGADHFVWSALQKIGEADVDVAFAKATYTSELQSPCNLVCRLLLEKKH